MFWLLLLTLLASACVLDHALLAAERRGWIYYRRRKATSGSISCALGAPVMEVFQPSRHILLEEMQREKIVRHEAGVGTGDPDDERGPEPSGSRAQESDGVTGASTP